MKKIPISILELATVVDGGNHKIAIDNLVKVAQHTEALGYNRIWMAEHHNMEYIASSATSVLIGHVAGKTSKIRVGSGGIMLPNHSPLVIAEQFGTLETMYPGRIDLGLGRAPGSDQETAWALRRNNMNASQNFPEDIGHLQRYFSKENSTAKVRAFPGEGLDIPLYILGSSTDSAYLAAKLGLPYAFAAHFAPAQFRQAIAIYRSNFKPSAKLAKPYVMACVNVLAADTEEEATVLLNSLISLIIGIITNTRKPLRPLKEIPEGYHIPEIKNAVDNMLACTFVGSKESIKTKVSGFIEDTAIDELIVTSHIYDLEAKLKSFSILKKALE
ncbi:LLM class flavin-dependent oxidoreductase [Arcticibacterium luteifluviistationis]|uniref:Luciferase-like monooxygenase n=1 Tax=Arcticibacterium luteifluviistationis TaxID=1784714 RepID=A0A2Z4GBT5_9BACT|nr:LLM class flavin-dependent oxidoreductase [Arcticibacterium luteifluviistationis]AWV98528.1 LLM class flavin-dependent oxidoreductase [Arcticibacterium luteifluviistationis]